MSRFPQLHKRGYLCVSELGVKEAVYNRYVTQINSQIGAYMVTYTIKLPRAQTSYYGLLNIF